MPPPPSHLQHRRAHNLLLVSKLLGCRENASPFTLIIDSLEQSGKGLVREFVRRANGAKTRVVFVAFETLRKVRGVDVFVKAAGSGMAWVKDVQRVLAEGQGRQKTLILFDTLNPLCAHPSTSTTLPTVLSSLLGPSTSLLATYHADVPLPPSSTSNPYSPHPLTLLKYLTTTILTTHSLSHILAGKAARDRSLAGPVFGLNEEIEGVLAGLGRNGRDGVVVEMEYRRKSGRGVREWFFLPSTAGAPPPTSTKTKETIILLEDHPLYRHTPKSDTVPGAGGDDMDVSFNLGLTEKQRRDREGVVLPYFDAQREEAMGQGGRILYDMGVEDDFDEEEDEI